MPTIKTKDVKGNQIEFNPENRRYRYKVNGEVKKGVTTLIGSRFAKNAIKGWAKKLPIRALEWQLKDDGWAYDKISNFIEKLSDKVNKLETQDATTGTLMHKLAEDYITKKKVVPPETEPLKTMFNKFIKWWNSKSFEVIATEQTCYSEELDVCGTFDAIIKEKKGNGKLSLIDFKTSKDFYIDQPIQLSTYKKLIEDSTKFKINHLLVINIPKEKVKDIEMRMFELKPRYLKAFKACKYLQSLEDVYNKDKIQYEKRKGKFNGK